MERITLLHRTTAANLPLIELDGLRTRVDLADRLGPVGPFDEAATGRYARGRRISGWVSRAQADARRGELGPGLVTFTVDPRRVLAGRAAEREADPAGAWSSMRTLAEWLTDAGGDADALPDDLEVHQDQPVRAKLVRLRAIDPEPGALGPYAALVTAVADADRVAAKLLMHLALATADGDAAHPAYLAACALAWRDEEDAADLGRRVARADAEAVIEAVLVEHEEAAEDGVSALREMLDGLRAEADASEGDVADVMLERSELSLVRITA